MNSRLKNMLEEDTGLERGVHLKRSPEVSGQDRLNYRTGGGKRA
jgi:hypothetical protein